MKILHIIPTYKPAYGRGGPIWSVHSLNKWLVKKGIDVTVYTTNIAVEEKVSLNRVVNIDGVKVYYFSSSFPERWEYSRKLKEAVRENIKSFDLVHITSVFLSVSTLGAYYARRNNIPYIISPRGSLMKQHVGNKNNLLKNLYLNLIEKINLRNSSGIHFTTKSEQEEYEDFGLPLSKPILIPNGIEAEEFELEVKKGTFRKKYNISKDKKIILFLGRISREKGLDTLIPAFKKISEKKDSVLFIAGGDDKSGYKSEVERMIKDSNLEDKVIFTGLILEKEKISAYQDADVFVLPSYSENFGIVILEAMYFGVPIITTDKVGISDVVEKSKSGIVVEKDTIKFSNAVLEILNNGELSKKMSENGKITAREKFSMDKITNKWIEVYKNIISNY